MKKQFRFTSFIIAMLLILASISFNNNSFATEENEELLFEEVAEEEVVEEEVAEEEEEVVADEEEEEEKEEEEKEEEEKVVEELAVEQLLGSENELQTYMPTLIYDGEIKIHKRIEWSDGGKVNANIKDGGPFIIKLKKPDGTFTEEKTIENGEHVIFDGLLPGDYEVVEIYPEDKYSGYRVQSSGNKNATIFKDNIVPVTGSGQDQAWLINILKETDPDPWKGTIKVYKWLEGQETPPEDTFRFELIDEDVNITGPHPTEDGQVDFTGLDPGKYEIREIPKEGYTQVSPEGSAFVTIGPDLDGGDANTWFVDFVNRKTPAEWNKGKVTVIKTKLGSKGKFGLRLPENPRGITFTLEGESLDLIESTTNGLGIAEFNNLEEGTYILKEQVPEGYKSSLPDEGLEVIVKKDKLLGLVVVLVVNKKLPKEPEWEGAIRVYKWLEGLTTIPEDTFEFELEDEDGNITGPHPTNDGQVEFTGLDPGEYQIREIPRAGYIQVSPVGSQFITIGPDVDGRGDVNTWFIHFVNRRVTTGSLTIKKTFSDKRNPEGVQFVLEGYAEMVATTNEDGVAVFRNLPLGEYTLTEVSVPGYESSLGNGIKVEIKDDTPKNLHPTIEVENKKIFNDIPVRKLWRGEAKEYVWVFLLADGVSVAEAKLNEDNEWQHLFEDMPQNDADGKLIEYTIHELEIEGYVSNVTWNDETGFTVTNTKVGENDIVVNKIWVGGPLQKPTITVNLFADNVLVRTATMVSGETSHVFRDMPKFDGEGNTIEYSVIENSVANYRTTYDGLTVINTYIPPVIPEEPDPRPDPRPEPEPELPEEEIEEEPVPEAQPEPEPEVKDETVEVPEEEEEVPEEPVAGAQPVATLPKTGTASPFMASGFGTILLAAGLFLRKKRK